MWDVAPVRREEGAFWPTCIGGGRHFGVKCQVAALAFSAHIWGLGRNVRG